LEQKIHLQVDKDDSHLSPDLEKSVFGNILFERDIFAEAKRLMGYIYGRDLSTKYIQAVSKSEDIHDPRITKAILEREIEEEQDVRYKECMGLIHNSIYLSHVKSLNHPEYEIDITNI
jgi:hypothetical protein